MSEHDEERDRIEREMREIDSILSNGWAHTDPKQLGKLRERWEELEATIKALDADEAAESQQAQDRPLDVDLNYQEKKFRQRVAVLIPDVAKNGIDDLLRIKTRFARDITTLMERIQRENDQLSNLRRTEASELADMLGLRNISGESEEQRLEAETVITVPQV